MENILDNNLLTLPLADIKNGYRFEDARQGFICLFCGRIFEEGVIFSADDRQVDARRAAAYHISREHEGIFAALLRLGPGRTSISEIQETVLRGIYAGQSDREIAAALGGKSESTVRNHRFHLRKRMKEAKIFLALMELLEERDSSAPGFVDFPAAIPAEDDSIIVTTDENRDILRKYFQADGTLRLGGLPKKQKAKLVVLNHLAGLFEQNRHYTEAEVDTTLRAAGDASGEIRRYLIDYGFLARKRDGSAYWRT